jgi:hypothetical protein
MRGSHRSSEAQGRHILRSLMPPTPDAPRNWSRTYVSVIIVEVVALLMLWWLQRHYGA